MIFIFKGFNAKAFIENIKNSDLLAKLVDFAKANIIKIRYSAVAALGLSIAITALNLSGVTLGVKVNYSGKNIAVVKNQAVFSTALNIATEHISDEDARNAIDTPKFSLTLTHSDKLETADNLADSIVKNTGDIEYATALVVDGEVAVVTKGDRMAEYLERHRKAYYIDGAENEASFVADVEIKDGYFLKSEVADFSKVKSAIDKLEVKTVSTVKTKIVIPFKTVTTKTSKQTIGYSKVTTAGCNGTSLKTETVENINGKETSRTEISNEVITKPVTKEVVVGTAIKKISATERAKATSAGFICPIAKGKYVISAYYGDGRNHKAIDLAADRGTPIFAVASGTVTYAGYDSDFGYNVIVKHNNGISTRYAHANALCVSKGQTVAQGDMIASVGSTGWSTGNHLHFEVIVNGVRVNPAPYIGL